MNIVHLKLSAKILVLFCALILATFTLTLHGAGAQTKTTDTSSSVTAEQQKQLDRLNELNEQLQKDRAAVDAAISAHGWDSNDADAAQQRLLQDRQQYRTLRQSLVKAGLVLPSDATDSRTGNQGNQGTNHCCGHGYEHHGCCDGDGHCAHHHDDGCCGRHGS
jgi:hypothetical protein